MNTSDYIRIDPLPQKQWDGVRGVNRTSTRPVVPHELMQTQNEPSTSWDYAHNQKPDSRAIIGFQRALPRISINRGYARVWRIILWDAAFAPYHPR